MHRLTLIHSRYFLFFLLLINCSIGIAPVKAQVVKGYVCGAETGKVYLRSQPKSSSQNANRTLVNGSAVVIQSTQNGFVYVTSDKGKGWITQRYVCQASSDHQTVKSLAYSVLKQQHGNAHGKIVINKVVINSGYAIASYFVGEGGGSFMLRKTGAGVTGFN